MIVTDYREPKFFVQYFEEHGEDHAIGRLGHGDFVVMAGDEERVYERKTWSDLWNTVKSDRMNFQLQDVDVLILEKGYIPAQLRKFFWSHRWYGVVNRLGDFVQLKFTEGKTDTARLLLREERKMADGTLHTLEIRRPEIVDSDQRVTMLGSIPGVSVVRARALLDRFGSIAGVVENRNNVQDVDGIGAKTRASIVDFLQS